MKFNWNWAASIYDDKGAAVHNGLEVSPCVVVQRKDEALMATVRFSWVCWLKQRLK